MIAPCPAAGGTIGLVLTRFRCHGWLQKYIGGSYQLPEEAAEEDAAAEADGKKQKHGRGKRLAITSLLRSEPATSATMPGADAGATDHAELPDELKDAEAAPELAAIQPQGLYPVA